jgi:hypothetical protein
VYINSINSGLKKSKYNAISFSQRSLHIDYMKNDYEMQKIGFGFLNLEPDEKSKNSSNMST